MGEGDLGRWCSSVVPGRSELKLRWNSQGQPWPSLATRRLVRALNPHQSVPTALLKRKMEGIDKS